MSRPLVFYKKGETVDILAELIVDLDDELSKFDHDIPMDAPDNQFCEFSVDIDVGSYVESLLRLNTSSTEESCTRKVLSWIEAYIREAQHNDVFRTAELRKVIVHGGIEDGYQSSETLTLWIKDYASIDGGYCTGKEFIENLREMYGEDIVLTTDQLPLVDQPSPSVSQLQPHEKIVENAAYAVSKSINIASEALMKENPEMAIEDCIRTIQKLMQDRLIIEIENY